MYTDCSSQCLLRFLVYSFPVLQSLHGHNDNNSNNTITITITAAATATTIITIIAATTTATTTTTTAKACLWKQASCILVCPGVFVWPIIGKGYASFFSY